MKEKIMEMVRGLDFYIGEHKDGLIFSDGKDFYAIKPVKKKRTYQESELGNLPGEKKEIAKKEVDSPFPIKTKEPAPSEKEVKIIETSEQDVEKLIDTFNISEDFKESMKKFR